MMVRIGPVQLLSTAHSTIKIEACGKWGAGIVGTDYSISMSSEHPYIMNVWKSQSERNTADRGLWSRCGQWKLSFSFVRPIIYQTAHHSASIIYMPDNIFMKRHITKMRQRLLVYEEPIGEELEYSEKTGMLINHNHQIT